MDAIIATIWESALDGDSDAIDYVLRIINQRSRMLDYPSIPMRDTATTAAAESGLTADEEALLMRVLHAMRDGRALGPVVDEAYLQLPASLDEPTPLPPGYPTDGK